MGVGDDKSLEINNIQARLQSSMNINPCDNVPMTDDEFSDVFSYLEHKADCIQHQYWLMKTFYKLHKCRDDELCSSNVKFKNNIVKWYNTFQPFSSVDDFKVDAGLALFSFDGAWNHDACHTLDKLKTKENRRRNLSRRFMYPIPIIKKTRRTLYQNTVSSSTPTPMASRVQSPCVTPPPTLQKDDSKNVLSPEEKARTLLIAVDL